MRKVVIYMLTSLDGVAEDPNSFILDWDDGLDAQLAAVIAPQDAVILGRRSYDEWAEYWPTSDVEPFVSFINPVQKHIATTRPLDHDWQNSTRIEGDLVGHVRELKQQPGGEIGVHASISVARQLLAAGLVDELWLVIAPHIPGRGKRLLEDLPEIRLEVIKSETSPGGYLLVNYRVLPPAA